MENWEWTIFVFRWSSEGEVLCCWDWSLCSCCDPEWGLDSLVNLCIQPRRLRRPLDSLAIRGGGSRASALELKQPASFLPSALLHLSPSPHQRLRTHTVRTTSKPSARAAGESPRLPILLRVASPLSALSHHPRLHCTTASIHGALLPNTSLQRVGTRLQQTGR